MAASKCFCLLSSVNCCITKTVPWTLLRTHHPCASTTKLWTAHLAAGGQDCDPWSSTPRIVPSASLPINRPQNSSIGPHCSSPESLRHRPRRENQNPREHPSSSLHTRQEAIRAFFCPFPPPETRLGSTRLIWRCDSSSWPADPREADTRLHCHRPRERPGPETLPGAALDRYSSRLQSTSSVGGDPSRATRSGSNREEPQSQPSHIHNRNRRQRGRLSLGRLHTQLAASKRRRPRAPVRNCGAMRYARPAGS